MNIYKLSYRNMVNRPLSTTLCLILLSLGVGIISLLWQVNSRIRIQMENNVRGVDMVVGAKGSPLQLILSAIYHIDDPTGNISLHEATKLQNNRLVATGIPLSYGDSYKGFRIVGTNFDYPKLYEATIANGRFWQEPFEVAIGAAVAKNKVLKVGDTFIGSHGLSEGGETHDEHFYKVVGVLNFTHSVLDRLILTSTESVWKIHFHEDGTDQNNVSGEHHEDEAQHIDHHEEHEDEQEITAMLIQFRNPMGIVQLPRMVNENTNMQAAVPSYEISRLFSLMGVGIDTLSVLAMIIMAVSGLSVFISLYNSLKDRQYEMALMRSYGATRWQIARVVLQEGLFLSFIGFVLGIFFSRIGLWLMSLIMNNDFHYAFAGWTWLNEEWWLLLIVLSIGFLASLIPSLRVYYINISKTLADD